MIRDLLAVCSAAAVLIAAFGGGAEDGEPAAGCDAPATTPNPIPALPAAAPASSLSVVGATRSVGRGDATILRGSPTT